MIELFNDLNITGTEKDIIKFVSIDNENSTFFQQEVLKEANGPFKKTSYQKRNMRGIYQRRMIQRLLLLFKDHKPLIFLMLQKISHLGRRIVF